MLHGLFAKRLQYIPVMRPGGTALILGLASLAAQPSAAQQAPPGSDLIQRASDYVVRFVDTLSNVVADEHYVQEASRFR